MSKVHEFKDQSEAATAPYAAAYRPPQLQTAPRLYSPPRTRADNSRSDTDLKIHPNRCGRSSHRHPQAYTSAAPPASFTQDLAAVTLAQGALAPTSVVVQSVAPLSSCLSTLHPASVAPSKIPTIYGRLLSDSESTSVANSSGPAPRCVSTPIVPAAPLPNTKKATGPCSTQEISRLHGQPSRRIGRR